MTTPWERELAEKARREANAHVAVVIPADTAVKMRNRPRLIFLTSVLTMIALSTVAFFLYGELRESLGLTSYGYSRRRGDYAHASQALLIVIPVLIFASALIVRFLFMRQIASEISRKIARKIKCRPEFEKALYKLVLSTPWSRYRFRWYRSRISASFRNQVTTEFGESRSVEFADDLSIVIIGPEQWVDPNKKTALDMLLAGKDPFRPSI